MALLGPLDQAASRCWLEPWSHLKPRLGRVYFPAHTVLVAAAPSLAAYFWKSSS